MDGWILTLFIIAAFAGGFGLTGLGGVVSTISCQWRGWTKDLQRAVFQPVLFAAFVVISVSMGITGAFTSETLKLYALDFVRSSCP